ncbi:putative lyase [Rosa chinensis]|uniref:Putative lyase n=1 Tax=Rosa chinensis TaxID=74649 RepID=A0A2P6QBL4_ROSCH|nr:(-)-germacrene D synthase [Rosa chinensis]PRQ31570.1 putative lyase [Rosa chinensis]
MPAQILESEAPTQNATPEVNRRSANFSPSIWGDQFLSYASNKESNIETEQHLREFKAEVNTMLKAPVEKLSQKLDLIDNILRLGVFRHFENEIHEILQQIHNNSYVNCDDLESDDELYTVALRFRLLRQQGYQVSCNVFRKFMDYDGNFKESLIEDVPGLLSLYEATHLRTHGEELLDDALTFTSTHLESATRHSLNPLVMKQVTHALYQPLWKGVTRLEARHHLSAYPDHNSHNETLLNFAKLDFNLLQQVHQKELSDIARWWKDLDFANKLPFARDRVVECYFWTLGVYFEPQYHFGRTTFCKVIAMTSIIDDIYDVYGTLEEAELFTEAIERWDISAMDILPEYMKICYQALLDVYREMEEKLAIEGNLYAIHYARESMKIQVRAYFREAKWFHQKYTPTLDEYMSLALVTSGYFMLATISFLGMGDIVTRDSFEWLFNSPKIVKASELVGRLMDDMASHKFEQKRGHVASAVECYMKEYGVTEEEAKVALTKQVDDAWKVINEELLKINTIPRPLLLRVLNLSRVIEVVYKNEDGYTHAGGVLKGFVASMLIKPVPI